MLDHHATSQVREPGALPAPELSVVIATDSYDSIRKVLQCFQAQGDPVRLEIVIASLGGETIEINYDDGDRERTKTGRCRSK